MLKRGSSAQITSVLQSAKAASPVLELDLIKIPNQINIKKLKKNGKLLTDAEINAVKQLEPGKYKKTTKDGVIGVGDSSVVVVQDREGKKSFFAVYEGAIAKGGFGKVRYAQDLDTGRFHAIKFQQVSLAAEKEFKILAELEQTSGKTKRTKLPKAEPSAASKSYQQHILVMDLAPGEELYQFMSKKNNTLNAAQWVNVALQQLTSIKTLHDKHILHCDIKPQNFIYNPITETVRAIDMGLALPGPEYQFLAQGSPHMLAPEIKSEAIKDINEQKLNTYNEKTEIFSLGLSIAHSLGLAYWHDTPAEILDKIEPEDKKSYYKKYLQMQESAMPHRPEAITKIPNEELRNQILSYLHKLTSDSPHDRPTMNQAIEFFQMIQSELISAPDSLKKTGILNAQTFLDADYDDKLALYETLKSFDEVVIIDPIGTCSQLQLFKLQQELKDIRVQNKYFSGSENNLPLAELVNEVASKMDAEDCVSKRNYFYLTPSDMSEANHESLNLGERFCLLYSDDEHEEKITEFLKGTLPLKKLLNTVTNALETDIERMQTKYPTSNEVISARINSIHETIATLRMQFNHRKLTNVGLHDELATLQTKMIATGLFSKWVRSGSAKKIGAIMAQIDIQQHAPASLSDHSQKSSDDKLRSPDISVSNKAASRHR